MLNRDARISREAIAPGHDCVIVDDALSEPERWVELAVRHRADFVAPSHNAYPGIELRLPDAISQQLERFFSEHVRRHFGARRTLRHYCRLSLATLQPAQLEPRQWICHRDRLDPGPDALVAACVLYLFRDPALGGTGFHVPRRSAHETAVLVHESGTLDRAAFSRKYAINAGYHTETTAWFERTAAIEARWNRLIFYDGGSVFHGSDIGAPERLSADPAIGRLTLNGFFVCRRSANARTSPSSGR